MYGMFVRLLFGFEMRRRELVYVLLLIVGVVLLSIREGTVLIQRNSRRSKSEETVVYVYDQ